MSFVIDPWGALEHSNAFSNIMRYHKRVCVCGSVIQMLSDKWEGGMRKWLKYLDLVCLWSGPLDIESMKENPYLSKIESL